MEKTKAANYFEGVLQLRNPSQKIIDFVSSQINKNNVKIGKSEKHKNGIDLYLSSNKFLKQIGKKLQNSFSGELIESKSLFTVNKLTSKKVYRGCILFRYYNIKKGDKLIVKGEELKILSINKDIYVQEVNSGKKKHIKFNNLS